MTDSIHRKGNEPRPKRNKNQKKNWRKINFALCAFVFRLLFIYECSHIGGMRRTETPTSIDFQENFCCAHISHENS